MGDINLANRDLPECEEDLAVPRAGLGVMSFVSRTLCGYPRLE